MEGTTRPRRSDRFKGKDLGEEYLFYDHDGDHVHVLNATARSIYLECDGRRTVDEIVVEFANMYEIDEQTARRDTENTLKRLLECELIEI